MRLDTPLRAALPEFVDALDTAYRSGEASRVPHDEGRVIRCTPLGGGPGRISGLLLRVVPDDDDRSRARTAGFQQLTEQLSRAATPAEIGRLTATTAAALIGADSCVAYRRPEGSDVMEALHHARLARATPPRATPGCRCSAGGRCRTRSSTGEPVWLEDAEQWRAPLPGDGPGRASPRATRPRACLPLRVEDRDLGAVVFSFYRPRAFDPSEREFLMAAAALCAQALDRARLYTAEHEARAAAERERDRMAFLAQASRLMEAPLSVEERLRQLGDLVVKGIADWSAVHLVRGTRVERVTVAHLDPAKIAFVEELERRYPPDPDAPGGAIEVARTGVPVVMPDVPDELLVASARDETHLELIRAIGLRSAIVVPLLVRGRSLGALTLVHAESGERFTEDGPDVRRPARRHRRARPRQRRPLRAAAHGRPHAADGAAAQRAARRARASRCAGRYRPPRPGAHRRLRRRRPLRRPRGPRARAVGAHRRRRLRQGPAGGRAHRADPAHRPRRGRVTGSGPADVVRRVNAAMLRNHDGARARFATMVHGALTVDPDGVTITLVNGGHPPGRSRILRGDGGETSSGSTSPARSSASTPTRASSRPTSGSPPATPCCSTPTASPRPAGRTGSSAPTRLASLVASFADTSADTVADGVLDAVSGFQDGQLRDDVALLVIRAAP